MNFLLLLQTNIVFVICPLHISQYTSCTSTLARLQGYLIKETAFFNIQKELLGLWRIQSSPPKSVTVQFTAWRLMLCAWRCWELRGKDNSAPPRGLYFLRPWPEERVGWLSGLSNKPEKCFAVLYPETLIQETSCSYTNFTFSHLSFALHHPLW